MKEERVRITVKYLKDDSQGSEEFVVTRRGLIKSKKNTATSFLVIGRKGEEKSTVIPNDIALPSIDRSVSRLHACFIYKYGFSKRRIPKNFVKFLSGKNKKIAGPNCKVLDLPRSSIRVIYSFLKHE